MKKQSNPRPIKCMANGYVNGGMCGFIIVGGKLCGLPDDGRTCLHQKAIRRPAPPPPPPNKKK